MTLFRSFLGTVAPFVRGQRVGEHHLLEDPVTGAPAGIQSKRANGPHGIWTPVDLTAAQIASPTADMIADLNAVFRLNVAPYNRYRSNGTTLIEQIGSSGSGPLTFTNAVTITGTTTGLQIAQVVNAPAGETRLNVVTTNYNAFADSVPDVLGFTSNMFYNTHGFHITSPHAAALFGTANAFDAVPGGTVDHVVGVMGASGNSGMGTVANAMDFYSHPNINNGGGIFTNHYAFYQEVSTAAANEYGGCWTAPSGFGTYTPGAWVDIVGPDQAVGTHALRVRNSAALLMLDILDSGAILSAALQGSTTYANDAAAAVGGVIPGQLYRNGSVVQLRVS